MIGEPWHFQQWAFRTIVGGPGPKAVLSGLAIMADTNTGRCEAKVATIAQGTEIAERTVSKHLKVLAEGGFIERRSQFRRDGGRRGDEFLLLAPEVVEWPDGTPVQNRRGGAQEGATPVHADAGGSPRSEGGQELPPVDSRPGNASARPREVRFRNRAVPRRLVEAGVEALAYFAECTGQSLTPFDGTGAASASLKRVLGGMVAHPRAADIWREMIDACLADPWWRDERPGVGVVFGPNVIEQSIAKAGQPVRSRNASGGPSAADFAELARQG